MTIIMCTKTSKSQLGWLNLPHGTVYSHLRKYKQYRQYSYLQKCEYHPTLSAVHANNSYVNADIVGRYPYTHF